MIISIYPWSPFLNPDSHVLSIWIFANEDHGGFGAFATKTTEIFCQVLGIPPENIYIKFDDIKAWSVGGAFIDRNRYR